MLDIFFLFFLFITRVTPPATRTDTLFPYTTRFRCPATATVGCPAQRQRYLSLSISRPSSAPPAAPSTVPSSLSPSPAISWPARPPTAPPIRRPVVPLSFLQRYRPSLPPQLRVLEIGRTSCRESMGPDGLHPVVP